MELISVLIPIHKKTDKNYRSVNSILNQTYRNIEIIILLDGLNEHLYKELNNYYKIKINTGIIRIFFLNKNYGLTKMLNMGLKESNGKFIMRNDYDDISLPYRAEEQMKIFNYNKDIKLVYSFFSFFNDKNNKLKNVKSDLTKNKLKNKFNYKNTIAHSSVMFNKDFIIKIGGYNESYYVSQDFELWSRLINNNINNIGLSKKILTKINLCHDSVSKKNSFNQRYNSIFICMNNKFYPKIFDSTKINNLSREESNYFNSLTYAYLYENKLTFYSIVRNFRSLSKVYFHHPSLLFKRILYKHE